MNLTASKDADEECPWGTPQSEMYMALQLQRSLVLQECLLRGRPNAIYKNSDCISSTNEKATGKYFGLWLSLIPSQGPKSDSNPMSIGE